MSTDHAHPNASELESFQLALADALTSADPVAALCRVAENQTLSPTLRSTLQRADVDGVGLSALIIARLRFERLMHGSTTASRWFDQNPREFTAAFKRYHSSVPPTSTFPAGEARAFEAWLDAERATFRNLS